MTVLSIKEILDGPKVSNYQGSEKTREAVSAQIVERWGKAELQNYDPEKSALPYTKWVSLGYRPKRGSKALKSVTYIEQRDLAGNVIKRYPRTVNLFYYRSVEPLTSAKTC
jgi:hypothetical protein